MCVFQNDSVELQQHLFDLLAEGRITTASERLTADLNALAKAPSFDGFSLGKRFRGPEDSSSEGLSAASVGWNDAPRGLMYLSSSSGSPSARPSLASAPPSASASATATSSFVWPSSASVSASAAAPSASVSTSAAPSAFLSASQQDTACCVCAPGGHYVGPFIITCMKGHPICGDCYGPFIDQALEKPARSILSGIPCVYGNCSALFPFEALPPPTLLRLTGHFATELIPKQNPDALTQVLETQLLVCSVCGGHVEGNPAGCNNFTCTRCDGKFCGCCFKTDCRDPGQHAEYKHKCDGPKSFCIHARKKGQNEIIKQQTLRFFRNLPLIDRQPCLAVLVPHLTSTVAKAYTNAINKM